MQDVSSKAVKRARHTHATIKQDVKQEPIPIEHYTSILNNHDSENSALFFSTLVGIVAFVLALALGYVVAGTINVFALSFAAVVCVLCLMSIHVAAQWERVVILRFGKFSHVANPGIYFTIPFIDTIAFRADQRVVMTGFSAEETLTADMVPINVDAVLFWMVWDAQKAILEVKNYNDAASMIAQTALRDAIGRASASTVAMQRDQLDNELKQIIADETAEWGITILSVKIRDIVIPKELQDVMSAEAQADREKNARILLAEVEKDISEMLVDAAEVYDENDTALRLRTMHLLYESVKNSGGTVVIPSAYADGFNDQTLESIAKAAEGR